MSMHILVVDDDAEMRLAARFGLEKAGHRVTEAADGAAAAALEEVPDVLLMDLLLGPHDGEDVARSLTARPGWERVPVVYLTARHDDATRARLRADGAAGVLAKPFDPFALPELLAAALAP
ncbi:MAG: response regulator [Gemmatimonadota bacterium]